MMLLSRRLDDKEIQLKNQSQIFFQISGAGHEAVLVAAGMHLRAGYDWFYPYYRDRALCLALGMTPLEMLLAGGRREGRPGVRRPPDAVALGPPRAQHRLAGQPDRHAVPAGGRLRRGRRCSTSASTDIPDREDALPRRRGHLRLDRRRRDERRRVLGVAEHRVHAAAAGASTWSRTTATRSRCPVEVQTPGGDISQLVASFPGPARAAASTAPTSSRATATMRRGRRATRASGAGPALVHAKVIRPYSHSLSDDERLYKTPEEREAEAQRDPLVRHARVPARPRGSRPRPSSTRSPREVEREVNDAADARARGAAKPTRDTAALYVFSPDVDPDVARRSRPSRAAGRQARHDGRRPSTGR